MTPFGDIDAIRVSGAEALIVIIVAGTADWIVSMMMDD